MWVDYKAAMVLLDVGHNQAYKAIKKLQDELEAKGIIKNPTRKVQVNYFCERYGIDEDYARGVIADLKKTA